MCFGLCTSLINWICNAMLAKRGCPRKLYSVDFYWVSNSCSQPVYGCVQAPVVDTCWGPAAAAAFPSPREPAKAQQSSAGWVCVQWSSRSKTQIISHRENDSLVLGRSRSHIACCRRLRTSLLALDLSFQVLRVVIAQENLGFCLKKRPTAYLSACERTTVSKGDWMLLGGSPV